MFRLVLLLAYLITMVNILQPLSAMEEWAEQINAEFTEVDDFQLTID